MRIYHKDDGTPVMEDGFTHQDFIHTKDTVTIFLQIMTSFAFAMTLSAIIAISRPLSAPAWLLVITGFVALTTISTIMVLMTTHMWRVIRPCKCDRHINVRLPINSRIRNTEICIYAWIIFVAMVGGMPCWHSSVEQGFLVYAISSLVASAPLFYLKLSGRLDTLQTKIDIATNPNLKAQDIKVLTADEAERCAEVANELGKNTNYSLLKRQAELKRRDGS